ncbi:MAG: sensor histidine kinase [Lachnospira sp.]|nr:sensor histidine kinase [Lachnospira sp.]
MKNHSGNHKGKDRIVQLKEKIKSRLRQSSLSKKIILIYVLFAGITCVASVLALQTSLDIYDSKLYENSIEELSFYISRVDENMSKIETYSYTTVLDKDIQQQLMDSKEFLYPSDAYSYKMTGVRRNIYEKMTEYPEVLSTSYYYFNSIRFKTGIDTGKVDSERMSDLLGRAHAETGSYVYTAPSKDYPYLLAARDIREATYASLDYLGTIVLVSNTNSIFYNGISSLQGEDSNVAVYSGENIVYSNFNEEKIAKYIPQATENKGHKIIRYQGERYFMCYLKSDKTGWTYVNMFPYTKIFGEIMIVRYILIGCFLILFGLMIFCMRKMSRLITTPLSTLSDSMQVVMKGDFDQAMEILPKETYGDEVGEITEEFKSMLEQINTLIRTNYEKQAVIQETKYRLLQAQINPHFLYNTLNAINWMIKARRNEEAGLMNIELGNLLHATFAQRPLATVEEEIGIIKSYITIQQFRYQNKLEFELERQGDLSEYCVPRMMIQPLVENSIAYGLENAFEKCRIRVEVCEEEQWIAIRVSDTGTGMSPQELEQIRNMTFTPKGHGIGLKNIKERLELIYESYQFHINSEEGKGTVISIKVPKLKEGEINV